MELLKLWVTGENESCILSKRKVQLILSKTSTEREKRKMVNILSGNTKDLAKCEKNLYLCTSLYFLLATGPYLKLQSIYHHFPRYLYICHLIDYSAPQGRSCLMPTRTVSSFATAASSHFSASSTTRIRCLHQPVSSCMI